MNKHLLAALLMFPMCSLYGDMKYDPAACPKLIVKPVVFLQLNSLIEPRNNEPSRLFELFDSANCLKNANDPLEAKLSDYRNIISQSTQTFHNSNSNDAEWQLFYKTKMEPIQKKIDALIEEQHKLGNEWLSTREAVLKKIAIAAENIAKSMGACAVINPYLYWVETYIDPSYDITERVMNQLNAEYLADNKGA